MLAVVQTPVAPMEEESGEDKDRSASSFWELHRKLADCYAQDMALRTDKRPAPNASPGILDTLSPLPAARRRRVSIEATSPSIMERREVSITTLLDSKSRAHTETDITLAPLACWKHKKKEKNSVSNNRAVSVDALMSSAPARGGSFTKRADGASSIDLPVSTSRKNACCKSWVLHPGGIRRTIWNMAVALGVLHDLIFIPMYVFDLPSTPFFKIMEWITQIFWNMDMLVSLFTGYYDEGVLILEFKKTVLHYAKTWMCFDLCLISMDWAIVWLDTLGSEQEGFIQWSRTISMLRFLRLIRMLRWVKLRRVNDAWQLRASRDVG